ncbi:hypothetical protein L596_028723 [Steinernema carpocapsae]|uniref:Cystatin domain-containing protein n=1 Tax=Steinernema carpocapsae TaxID=34508 RepID=A0A4V5ZY73_STECR|nr:hypothetical protein L596_028723 [Steinernema carpocapsae]
MCKIVALVCLALFLFGPTNACNPKPEKVQSSTLGSSSSSASSFSFLSSSSGDQTQQPSQDEPPKPDTATLFSNVPFVNDAQAQMAADQIAGQIQLAASMFPQAKGLDLKSFTKSVKNENGKVAVTYNLKSENDCTSVMTVGNYISLAPQLEKLEANCNGQKKMFEK